MKRPFLGRGWSFPPTFNLDRGGVEMLEEEADIASSLEVLLTTTTIATARIANAITRQNVARLRKRRRSRIVSASMGFGLRSRPPSRLYVIRSARGDKRASQLIEFVSGILTSRRGRSTSGQFPGGQAGD